LYILKWNRKKKIEENIKQIKQIITRPKLSVFSHPCKYEKKHEVCSKQDCKFLHKGQKDGYLIKEKCEIPRSSISTLPFSCKHEEKGNKCITENCPGWHKGQYKPMCSWDEKCKNKKCAFFHTEEVYTDEE